jgi:hypothetical protein
MSAGSGGDGDGGDTDDSLPAVENPPDVVYVPSHREGVEHLGMAQDGPFEFGAMISYAHPFWLVTGEQVQEVEVGDDVDVHLMATVRDAETGTALPTGGALQLTVERDGTVVDDRKPWRMLSQQMGLHAGDNVPLDGDGEYEVTVAVPGVDPRTTGAFADRFEGSGSATFSFTYDQALRDALIDRIEYVEETKRGVPGAIEPMDAADSVPEAESLPGTLQGVPVADGQKLPRSHDADVAITVLEEFLGNGEPYLLVSPRTPYNRFPLVGMGPDATIRRDGSEVASPPLQATLDDEAGFHYGASIPALQPGDDVRIGIDAPPGVARHQGYETAFLEMEPIEVTLEAW